MCYIGVTLAVFPVTRKELTDNSLWVLSSSLAGAELKFTVAIALDQLFYPPVKWRGHHVCFLNQTHEDQIR